jgi:hypothetical protein
MLYACVCVQWGGGCGGGWGGWSISTSILFPCLPRHAVSRIVELVIHRAPEASAPRHTLTQTTEDARNARALSISLYLSKDYVRRSPSVSCPRRSAHLAVI